MKSMYRNPMVSYPVTHALHISQGKISQVIPATLAGLPGVLSVNYDSQTGVINITYDLRRTHLEDIELSLQEMGLELQHGFWSDLYHKMVLAVEELEDEKQYAISHVPDNPNDPFLYRKLQEKNARELIFNRSHQH
ncbi:MAG: cation transporter [Magnetococcales bacterium]|nr:cation transporter [Magnetococcales bacterium]NGZ29386.1 cation transporter [Magnetococcales bacterium]